MPPIIQADDPFILTRDAIKVLSVDTRLDILKLLDDRPHTLTEIKDELELAAATVSEHLAKLEESGLIEKRDEGRKWKYYSLTDQGRKLFAKKPAGLMFAFVLSTVAAGAFTIASLIRVPPQPEMAPMMARDAMVAESMALDTVAATPPDWLMIGALAFAILAGVLLILMLAKRLKKNA